jgi:hypothetical protein
MLQHILFYLLLNSVSASDKSETVDPETRILGLEIGKSGTIEGGLTEIFPQTICSSQTQLE